MLSASAARPPLWLVLDTALVAAGAAYAFYLLSERPPEVALRHEVGMGPLGGPTRRPAGRSSASSCRRATRSATCRPCCPAC